MSLNERLDERSARLAFLFILGREPEDAAVLQYALSFGTVRKLREALLNSVEFELVLHRRPRMVQADAPPLHIVWQAPAQGIAPAGGTAPEGVVAGCLARNGLTAGPRVCHFAGGPIGDWAGPFDLWTSFFTLQHCPPPLAAHILARAFAALAPGGVAIFQLAAYGYGYSYTPDNPPPPAGDAAHDRHVLPQSAVFELAAQAGCTPCEVFDDLALPPSALWRSSVFVLRKAP